MGKRRTAEDRLRATAYHEAGHAVAQLKLPPVELIWKDADDAIDKLSGASMELAEIMGRIPNEQESLSKVRETVEKVVDALCSGVSWGVESVTIEKDGDCLGLCWNSPIKFLGDLADDTNAALVAVFKCDAVCDLCGLVAEKRYTGRHNYMMAGADLNHVRNTISFFYGDPGDESTLKARRALFKSLVAEAELLIDRNWHAVVAVAEALMERKTLTGDEVRAVVREANLARLPKKQRKKLEQQLNGR